MMTGSVQNLHALLPITFRLPKQPDLIIDFVVDTGFTGPPTLPPDAVAAMNLSFVHHIWAGLADGSLTQVAVHTADILWMDAEKTVRVLATGNRPLLGTTLLEDCELVVQFRENAPVTVDML